MTGQDKLTLPADQLAREAAHLRDVRRDIERDGVPANTRRAYEGDWRRFVSWCNRRGQESLPASHDVIGAYVSYMLDPERPRATRTTSGRVTVGTVERALSAITRYHQKSGLASPVAHPQVKELMKEARRARRQRRRQAAPLLVEHLREIVETMLANPDFDAQLVMRDRALLLLGFAMAARRSELAALDRIDLDVRSDGLVVHITHSKANQDGQELEFVPVETADDPKLCPLRALRRWLELVPDVDTGPVFRKSFRGRIVDERMPDWQVDDAVKRWTQQAGIKPTGGNSFSAHSLRAGVITEATKAGRSESIVMHHSRHKTFAVFHRYVRLADPFSENPVKGLL
jgi:integrase